MKVLKFGGTSMANADSIKQVGEIVKGDSAARYVVVSAPGKRNADDVKVTDLLYECISERETTGTCNKTMEKVKARFDDIIAGLDIKLDISRYIETIRHDLNTGAGKDYAASRGEYLSAIVFAAYIGYEFIDAANIIRFDSFGNFDSELTDEIAKKRLKQSARAVIPGFYGMLPNHHIKTFSRGGSDITGSIIARAAGAEVYENWTDVDGFMVCDPRIVKNPAIIEMITYKELRELSYMGANVLHPDSIFPVRKSDIPIHIRNTFNPSAGGTMIVPTKNFVAGAHKRAQRTITGIAGKGDFAAVYMDKSMMNNELGFIRRALGVMEKFGVSVEHTPSGIDTLTVVFDKSGIDSDTLNRIMEEMRAELHPDKLEFVENLALVAVVGHGMSRKKGTASRVCAAISDADINIRMIDQGSSEVNIIIAVEQSDLNNAIAALYDEFRKG